jgi:hypothetical protein
LEQKIVCHRPEGRIDIAPGTAVARTSELGRGNPSVAAAEAALGRVEQPVQRLQAVVNDASRLAIPAVDPSSVAQISDTPVI